MHAKDPTGCLKVQISYKNERKVSTGESDNTCCVVNYKPNKQSRGMKKCGKPCPTCPFVKEGKSIKYKKTNWEIYGKVNCETKNVIYLIECNKESCKIRYIGETGRKLKERFNDHKNYIKSIIPTQSTGEHFNTIVKKEDKNFTVVCSLQIREGLKKKTRFLSTFCG